jgi:Peptidase family M23
MADTAIRPQRDSRPGARIRPWIALAAAVALSAVVVLGVLPITYVAPVIGVVLALGSPSDYRGEPRPVAARPRNLVLGAGMIAALAAIILMPQLTLPLVALVGLRPLGLIAPVLVLIALALPLAMTDAEPDARLGSWFLLTRRNLILSLTVLVTVGIWYGGPGLSYLPIAVLVIVLPVFVAISRLVAARRLQLGDSLLRQPLRPGLAPQRLQLVNVVVLCGLLALTLGTGTYDAAALGLSQTAHRVFVALFLGGLVAFVLLALVPLRGVRMGSNVLVVVGSIFLAVQLVLLYLPAAPDAVTIGSPLAEDWWVSQGGHAELVNYHQVGSTQQDALDIEQVVDGSTHRPGAARDPHSYYIYEKPVLAPADGVITFVLDGRPDLPIGEADARFQAGNQIVMDIGAGHYLAMHHLRQNSLQVRVGDDVTEGQQIALVGNSGNTTEPHIHIQAQTMPAGVGDIRTSDVAETLRNLHTYQLVFRDATLIRSGVESRPSVVDPRRGDIVRPAH